MTITNSCETKTLSLKLHTLQTKQWLIDKCNVFCIHKCVCVFTHTHISLTTILIKMMHCFYHTIRICCCICMMKQTLLQIKVLDNVGIISLYLLTAQHNMTQYGGNVWQAWDKLPNESNIKQWMALFFTDLSVTLKLYTNGPFTLCMDTYHERPQ